MPGEECGEVSLETLKSWLTEGVDNPERLENVRFVVLEESRSDGKLEAFKATSPSIPVTLSVADLGPSPIPAYRVSIETSVATVDMDAERKLRVYRALLLLSKLPLVKVYLYTEEHAIALAVDLDKRSLGRREFNDAIAALAIAYSLLVRELGLEEEASAEALRNLQLLAAAQLREGRSRREVEEMLVKAGLPRELADKIVESVYGPRAGEEGGEGFYT